MRINCQKEDLLYGVQAVARGISGKNTLPILGGIMIEAAEDKLIFRATDLEMAVECIINAEILEPGLVVVPGKYFSELVRYLPNSLITLASQGKEQLAVDYEQSQLFVNCFDPEEFPALPQVEGEISGLVAPAVFRRLVRQVSIAAAQDEIRPIFAGILLETTPQEITMIATDTHRLAIAEGGWQGKGKSSLILPSRTLQEIARLAVNDDEMIKIITSSSQVYFCFGNITFITRVISGQYPEYRQVLPGENLYITKAFIDKQKLLESLERAALLGRDLNRGKGSIVKLSWGDDLMTISADVPDMGRIKEEIGITQEGQNLEASYNSKYLMEALKVIEGEKVIMRLTGPATPGIIMPDESPDHSSYLYLILPIRVN